jgi:hypothetical protein
MSHGHARYRAPVLFGSWPRFLWSVRYGLRMPPVTTLPPSSDLENQEELQPLSAMRRAPEPQRNAAPPAFLSGLQRELLRKTLCQRLDDDMAAYFFEVCERTHLDPFIAQIRPDIRRKKDEQGVKVPSMIVITTLQGLRGIGDRTGLLDGEDPVEWTGKDGVWRKEWLGMEYPLAARGSVHRKDHSRPQICVCRWDAFVQKVFDRNGKEVPNSFWEKMGSHMLGKCALAACYRGLFPNQASALYIEEELGSIEGEDTESEEAIEAEMKRRATREKETWEKLEAKGIKPVGVVKTRKREAEVYVVDGKEAARERAEQAAQEEALNQMPEVAPPPPAPQPTRPPPPPPPAPIAEPLPAGNWANFPITRIKAFVGRSVGDLSLEELEILRVNWMNRVERGWADMGNDIKAHYRALQERLTYEAQQEVAADGRAQAVLDAQFESSNELPFN